MHILFTAHCFYFMLYRLLFTLSLNIHYRFPFNTTECYFASDFSAHTSSLAEYLHSHGL